MRVYQLSAHEENLINNLNKNRSNVLMIICDHGTGPVLEMDALESVEFEAYMNAIVHQMDPARIVEIEIPELGA